jgi:cytochrome P450
MVPAHGVSDAPAYDPMRQFSQLAGDVRAPYPMLADLRETTLVLRVGAEVLSAGQPADAKAPKLPSLFTVFPHEYVRQVLTDNMRFSSACHAMTMGHVMGRTTLEMDPPEHQRHRALIAGAFRPGILDQWAGPIIGATVNELISAFAGDGQADLIRQLTFPFPVRVISRILELPEADWPRFLRLSTQLIAIMRDWDGALAASRELRGYFAEIIASRRRNTGDDLVSQLIQAQADGQRLTDEQIYPFLLLLPAGAETTYRSSSNLLFGLLTHQDQLEVVRADRGLLPQAIEEAQRREPPLLHVARMAGRDLEPGGVPVPEGAFITVSLGAANRGPRRYPDPDTFDIFRERRQHVSFGAGPHMCLGVHLARLEHTHVAQRGTRPPAGAAP